MENCAVVLQNDLLEMAVLERASECLKTIAHPVRLRIIQILLLGDRPVGELAEACGIPSHMMSEHLRILKDRRMLDNERRGRKVYYRIAEPCLADIMKCVAKGRF